MKPLRRRPPRDMNGRRGVKRAVVLMPNGLTLFNLFCGIYAIILAIHKDFAAAPGFIVLGGIADALDGRVARATGTGSRFGEELDSLVDAISFGLAPAMIVYMGRPLGEQGTLDWLLVFIFTACAVMRLARFNVEQAGRAKTHFHGLPSPAAGLTLASYYWFSQTPLYNQTVILFTDSRTLSTLPWTNMMRGLIAILAALMVSDVPYPAFPSIGFNSIKKLLGTLVVFASLALLLVRRQEFIFPALVLYVAYGVVKWMIIGLLGRSSTPDQIYWEREAELHQVEDPNEIYDRPPIAQEALEDIEDESAVPVRRREERREREGGREGGREERREGRRESRPEGGREERRKKKKKKDGERVERGERPERGERGEARRDEPREERREKPPVAAPVAAPIVAPIVVPSVDGPPENIPDFDEVTEDAGEDTAETERGPEGSPEQRRRHRRRRGGRNRQRGERSQGGETTESSDGGDGEPSPEPNPPESPNSSSSGPTE